MRLCASVAALAVCAWPAAAGAEPSDADRATARALFEEGRALLSEGRFDQACPKLRESLRLVPGAGTRFHLADCYEKSGKLASAWVQFLEVAAETGRAGQAEREAAARRRAEAARAQAATLRIEVRGRVNGIEVTRNLEPVPEAQWGSELPVDPGSYQISLVAPGYARDSETVNVVDAGAHYAVTLGPLRSSVAQVTGVEPAEVENDDGGAWVAGWVVASVGAALTVAGTVTYVVGNGKVLDTEDTCGGGDPKVCEVPGEVADNEEASQLANDFDTGQNVRLAGVVLLVPGVSAAAAGLVVALVAGPPGADSEPTEDVSLAPLAGEGTAGIVFHARW